MQNEEKIHAEFETYALNEEMDLTRLAMPQPT